jgi:hypothetical protein
LGAKWAQNLALWAQIEGWLVSKGSRINVNFAVFWSGRWESNPRPKLGKLILKRENARIGGIFAFFDVPQMDSNWSSQIGEVVAPINLTGTKHSPERNGIGSKSTRGRIYLAQLASFTTGICCCSFPAICCSLLSLGTFVILFTPTFKLK